MSGIVPEGAEIIETMDILVASEGYDLVRISDEENIGNSVWLRESDKEENYKEEQIKDDDTE